MSELTLSTMSVFSGTPEHTVLRVKRLGSQWIVENYVGVSIGEASDRDAAILMAREACDMQEASLIAVLNTAGEIETILDV